MDKKLTAQELAVILDREIESSITKRVEQIANPVLRKAVEEIVRDAVQEKLSQVLPKQVDRLVDESIREVTASLLAPRGAVPRALKTAFPPASGGKGGGKTSLRIVRALDSGSKSGSGGKTSPKPASGGKDGSGGKTSAAPVRRRSSSGGKGGGFGGK